MVAIYMLAFCGQDQVHGGTLQRVSSAHLYKCAQFIEEIMKAANLVSTRLPQTLNLRLLGCPISLPELHSWGSSSTYGIVSKHLMSWHSHKRSLSERIVLISCKACERVTDSKEQQVMIVDSCPRPEMGSRIEPIHLAGLDMALLLSLYFLFYSITIPFLPPGLLCLYFPKNNSVLHCLKGSENKWFKVVFCFHLKIQMKCN